MCVNCNSNIECMLLNQKLTVGSGALSTVANESALEIIGLSAGKSADRLAFSSASAPPFRLS